MIATHPFRRRVFAAVAVTGMVLSLLSASTSPVAGVGRATLAASSSAPGYWLVSSDGGVYSYGTAGFYGAASGAPLRSPIVAMAPTPSGSGYWMSAADGGIFAFGDAPFLGSTGGTPLASPIVGMAATPSGRGYWLVASDGGVFAFGDAPFLGSTGGIHLNRPVVGMASTPSGRGYWLVASDGGIFAFGDAAFDGSTGAVRLNRPIVTMAATPGGGGYWLVASDGGVFAFGDAAFLGSTGGISLNRPIVTMAASPSGGGYWLVASDGGVFTFGDAPFLGSAGGLGLSHPITSAAAATASTVRSTALRFSDGFASLPTGLGWAEGSVHGGWTDEFNGFGAAGIVSTATGNALSVAPAASASPAETHAALVTTVPSFGTIDLNVSLQTVRQLRTGSTPNDWEVGWVLWNYTDNTHFSYLILKPDGWELGKEDPAYPGAQRFLATGTAPFAVGSVHDVRVQQSGSTITVSADGAVLTTFTDGERPYFSGKVGLYSEDAEVHFLKVTVA